MSRILANSCVVILTVASYSLAQNATEAPKGPAGQPVPIYRVTVVEHGIDAVNYQYRAAPTKVDFRGTVLLPDAKGEAMVQARPGRTEIDAKFEKLPAPSRFGREYLTYVLWAVSPDGGSYNIGEIIPNSSDRASLRVTTDLQTFGLIVTAEPYAAVRQPSNVVALENHARPDTIGKVQQIQPKAELMPRGQYTFQVPESGAAQANAPKVSMSRYEAILELYQAQNAVNIAQAANAQKYAPDAFAAAQSGLSEAQRLNATKANPKTVVESARRAAQHAEDARLISERRKQDEDLAAAERAKAQAEAEARQARAEAEAARQQADRATRDSSGSPAPAPAPAPAAAPAPPPPAPHNQADREVREPATYSRLIERLDRSLAAQDTPAGVVITLPSASFDGANLVTGVSQKLTPIGSILASQPAARVNVESYTDASGSELQSWERAEAVKNTLLTAGVPANQISIRGSRAQSSPRVEIVISGGQ